MLMAGDRDGMFDVTRIDLVKKDTASSFVSLLNKYFNF